MSDRFALFFTALYVVAVVVLLALLIEAFGAAWLRRARAGWAWLRLQALLRWRGPRSTRDACRVVGDLDLDVELLILLADFTDKDVHERCCAEPFDTSGWLDDQPIEVPQEIPRDGGEGGNR